MSEYRYTVHHTDWTDESRTELRQWDEDIAPTTAFGREVTPTDDVAAWDAFLAMLVRFGAVPCWDVLVSERERFARTGAARLNGVSVKRVEEPTNPALRALRHHVSGAVERGESESIVGIDAEPTQCQWFALCDRVAVTVIPHPVLGDVPACSRCEDRYRHAVGG